MIRVFPFQRFFDITQLEANQSARKSDGGNLAASHPVADGAQRHLEMIGKLLACQERIGRWNFAMSGSNISIYAVVSRRFHPFVNDPGDRHDKLCNRIGQQLEFRGILHAGEDNCPSRTIGIICLINSFDSA